MKKLVVYQTEISRDEEGRYSLNDLHKAAIANGKATASQRPAEFLKSKSVKAFVQSLSDATNIASVVVHKGGVFQGSFAVELLAIRYAAWIDPAFEVAVYDKFRNATPPAQNNSLPGDYIEALSALLESEKQKAIMAPKAEVFDRIVERTNLLNATQVGQAIGMSAIKLNQVLTELNVYNRNIKRSKAFQQWFVDAGYGEMKQTEQGYPQALFSTSGQAWVVQKLTSEGVI